MFATILGTLGKSLGANLGGGILGALSYAAATHLGHYVDNRLFNSKNHHFSEGFRLNDLSIQTATYGKYIPLLFGKMKICGNIIWSTPIQENPVKITSKVGGGGSKTKHTHTKYLYSVSLAIAVCKGEISNINRIWFADQVIDQSNYTIRVYNGDEQQLPDPLIVQHIGQDKTPAFRGLAYVVFENLSLEEFGNRIPQISFEAVRTLNAENSTAHQIQSICVAPGVGEFTYDTIPQYKKNKTKGNYKRSLNLRHNNNLTEATLSISNLKNTLPNIKWVAVTVAWFANSLNIKHCQILPGVDSRNKITEPNTWKVAHYTRNTAYQISTENAKAIYEGTINDQSLIRYLQALRIAGYQIMLCSTIIVDHQDKPSPSQITGDAQDVQKFFTDKDGYNNFIKHYANIAAQHADAFLIGSEMTGLTSIQHTVDLSFPAVDCLLSLAREVKQIVGVQCKVSYAANYTEYHHTQDNWHHLDTLWASKDIDFVGINAYFPLSKNNISIYDIEKIKQGWFTGEGYDFVYQDNIRTTKQPISPNLAWKNLKFWWENQHINPDNQPTAWKPQMKKIWFTEYGFPSQTCPTNSPSRFKVNVKSLHGNALNYSNDNYAQEQAIIATELAWQNSTMVENKFLWCWSINTITNSYDTKYTKTQEQQWYNGHYIQGKFTTASLKSVIIDICTQCSLQESDLEILVVGEIEGFIVNQMSSGKQILQQLEDVFSITCREHNGKLEFINKQVGIPHQIDHNHCIPLQTHNGQKVAFHITKTQTFDMPSKLLVNYITTNQHYTKAHCFAVRNEQSNKQQECIEIPFLLASSHAQIIAQNLIDSIWRNKEYFTFMLPFIYHKIKPGDILEITYNNVIIKLLVISLTIGINGIIQVEACRS